MGHGAAPGRGGRSCRSRDDLVAAGKQGVEYVADTAGFLRAGCMGC